MVVPVPHDVLLNHILPRVPPKSIGRFRCVSKGWHSLLTSKMLENTYIHHHQNNIKLLVFFKTKTSSFEFTTIDCEAPPSGKGLTPARHPLPQFGDKNHYRVQILTSFHGLVCLGIQENNHDSEYSDLILWNPLTKEYKRLSKFNSHKRSKYGLYYSYYEDDYKLLSVDYYACIYSLKSDTWRNVDTFQSTPMLDSWNWSRGTYLKKDFYFLQHHGNNGPLSSVIMFDTKTERFSRIETRNVVDDIPNASNYFATIVVISDCIHVCVKYNVNCDNGFRRICIKFWELDEYGNMKEVLTYQLRHREQRHISSLCPFYLMKNGKWLMITMQQNWWSSYKLKIYKVDLKKNKHVKGNIYDDDFEYVKVRVDGNNHTVLHEQGRYIETFVSPNRYMK